MTKADHIMEKISYRWGYAGSEHGLSDFLQTTLPGVIAHGAKNTVKTKGVNLAAGAILPFIRAAHTAAGKTFGNILGKQKTLGKKTMDWKMYLKSTPWKGHDQQIPARLWSATAEMPNSVYPQAMGKIMKGLTDYGPLGTAINLAIPAGAVYGIKKALSKKKK